MHFHQHLSLSVSAPLRNGYLGVFYYYFGIRKEQTCLLWLTSAANAPGSTRPADGKITNQPKAKNRAQRFLEVPLSHQTGPVSVKMLKYQ